MRTQIGKSRISCHAAWYFVMVPGALRTPAPQMVTARSCSDRSQAQIRSGSSRKASAVSTIKSLRGARSLHAL